jgi:protein gp37
MSDNTKIEWTEATWNPITGCSVISAGCTNCYAMKLAGTRLAHIPSRAGLTQPSKAGPVWNGQVRLNEEWLDQPLRWKRPRMIFVCAHGDLFHESVPDEWIDRVFAVMALCPQHTFQVLTKRSVRMREYLTNRDSCQIAAVTMALEEEGTIKEGVLAMQWPLPNVWLGVSVEDQQRADERIPDLLATPAAVRWLSAEPLLGPVDLATVKHWSACNIPEYGGEGHEFISCLRGENSLDWVVAGGESGPGARPMHPDWARSLRHQCAAADVQFFFKQWGEWSPSGDHLAEDTPEHLRLRLHDRTHVFERDNQQMAWVGKKQAGRLLDGALHDGMPGLTHD